MKPCVHTSWLSLHGKENLTLKQASTLNDITSRLEDPAEKWPSLLVLIGNENRSTVMRCMLPKGRNRRSDNLVKPVNLQIDPQTTFTDRPVLFAHGEIPKHITPLPDRAGDKCHQTTSHDLRWSEAGPIHAFNAIYSRLIHPFAEVICMFASDCGGLPGVADRLALWLALGTASTLRPITFPRLLVIAEPTTVLETDTSMLASLLKLLRKRSVRSYNECFSGISVLVNQPSSCTSTMKDRILRESDKVRNERIQNYSLFNAVHLGIFFNLACENFVRSQTDPFDFITASRVHRPVPDNLSQYLMSFLTHVNSVQELKTFGIPMIASSLAQDNYTYDVHYFDPKEVYANHYKDACTVAAGNMAFKQEGQIVSTEVVLRTAFTNMMEQEFTKRSALHRTGARWHRLSLISDFRAFLSKIQTDSLCLLCLQRRPEHNFPCQHIFCEACVQDVGESTEDDPLTYVFECCPLCLKKCKKSIRVRPVTAGVRILSIDGGGIRGVIPIQFLRLLEREIGLPMPIQENFDFAFGTSSGALIILAMYMRGLSIDETLHTFQDLAKRAFRGRAVYGVGFIAAVQDLITSYIYGRYPSKDMDEPLCHIFGESTMLDNAYLSSIGAKAGFPIVDVNSEKSTRTCLVTSYNGVRTSEANKRVGHRKGQSDYRMLCSENPRNRILVRDAARCASAAPWYFKPHEIPKHGVHMDGGVWKQNPCWLALLEAGLEPVDHLISIGTGASRVGEPEDKVHDTYTGFRYGSIPQMVTFLMTHHFDGDREFNEFLEISTAASPEERADFMHRYRRFNVRLDAGLPGLADVDAMATLTKAAWEQFSADQNIPDAARASDAAKFYFELKSLPIFEEGEYTCYGRILCRLPVSHPAFASLMEKLDSMSAQFYVGNKACPGRGRNACSFDRTGNFNRSVSFSVVDLGARLDIKIELLGTHLYHISASPVVTKSLIKLQKLEVAALKVVKPLGRRLPHSDSMPVSKRRRHGS